MAWLVDPKKWDDAWHRHLSYPAMIVWDACLTSRLRLSIPGLLANSCEFSLSAVTGKPIEDMKAGLVELQRPDAAGKQHLFFDADHRVIRIPAAPKYNKADNPNILFKWFKEWCDTPDSQLRWDHIDSLTAGVNFRKGTMAAEWEATFGRVLSEYRVNGKKLVAYAELHGEDDENLKRSRNGYSNPGTKGRQPPQPPPQERSSNGSKPLRSGSGSELEFEFEIGSGSGSDGFRNRHPDHNDSSTHESFQKEQKALKHGQKAPASDGIGVPGGHHPDEVDPESHPSTASPARRREFELAGWYMSPFGLWIPPGVE